MVIWYLSGQVKFRALPMASLINILHRSKGHDTSKVGALGSTVFGSSQTSHTKSAWLPSLGEFYHCEVIKLVSHSPSHIMLRFSLFLETCTLFTARSTDRP